MNTPTPAPALTAEQIDNMAGTFCDAYLRTLPPFGHPVGKDLFRRWYAAVIARAKREEREEITTMCDDYRASLYADERNREATKPTRDALAWVTAKLRHTEATR